MSRQSKRGILKNTKVNGVIHFRCKDPQTHQQIEKMYRLWVAARGYDKISVSLRSEFLREVLSTGLTNIKIRLDRELLLKRRDKVEHNAQDASGS